MLLNELFDETEGSSVVQEIRDAIIDMLTPLAAQGVPKVSVQQIIDKMREEHTGVAIDRALVMHVLDPQEVKLVTKIEGDAIHFNLADEDKYAAGEDQQQKDEKHMKSTALKQATKSVQDKGAPAPAPKPSDNPF